MSTADVQLSFVCMLEYTLVMPLMHYVSIALHAVYLSHCCNAGNGDHVLFKKLHSLLVKGLARETVEWKR